MDISPGRTRGAHREGLVGDPFCPVINQEYECQGEQQEPQKSKNKPDHCKGRFRFADSSGASITLIAPQVQLARVEALSHESPGARIRACRLAGGPRFAFAAPLSGLYPFRYPEPAKACEWGPRGFDGFLTA